MRIILIIVLALWAVNAIPATLVKQEVRGNTRICYYQAGPDTIVKTVPASDPCPASI